MKKFAVLLLSLVLIVVLLLGAVVFLSPTFLSKYKEPILARVSGSLNREITMGDIRLTLLKGFGLRLKDVTVANAQGFRQEPMLTMGGLDLKVKFLPLLRKELQVEKVILQQPRIVIEKDSKGAFNLSDLAGGDKASEAGKEAGQTAAAVGPEAMLAGLLVSQIMISDGALTYYDAGSPPFKDGVRVENFNLSIEDVSLEKPIPFSLAFGVNRDGTDVKMKGVVGPIGKELKVDKVPLSAQVALDKFAVKRVLQFMEAPSFTIDEGALSLNADVSGDLASGLKLSGVVDIDGLILSDPAKKEMLVGLDTSVNVAGNLSGLLQPKMNAEIDVASPNLVVRLPKRNVAHRIKAPQFVQWLIPEVEAATAKKAKPSGPGGSGGLNAQGKINIAKGTIGDIPFSDLMGNYSKKGDVVRVTAFSVKGFGPEGVTSGNMTLNLAGDSPSYQVDLNAAGIDLATLQDTFTARREKVVGALSAKLNLSGAGFDSPSIQRNLKGGGDFKVTEGRLTNVNLEERIFAALGEKFGIPVAALAQELGVEIAPGDETPFDDFFGVFQIGSGQIRVQDSSITSRNHGFSANGNVGLDEQLNMKAKMILRKVGDIKQKKFTYYLIDEKSQKYIPFNITGKSSKPKVMVDVEALVKGQARQAVEEQKEKVKEKIREKLGPEGDKILKPLEKIFKF